MPDKERIIPADSVSQTFKSLHEYDPLIAQEYKNGLITGEINADNHVNLLEVDKEWLQNQINEKRAVQSAIQGLPKKPNRALDIMQRAQKLRQNLPKPLNNITGSVNIGNMSGKIRYDGEIRGRKQHKE